MRLKTRCASKVQAQSCKCHWLLPNSKPSSVQGPAQAQNLRDSLAEAKSDIVVKVISFQFYFQYFFFSLCLLVVFSRVLADYLIASFLWIKSCFVSESTSCLHWSLYFL